MKLFFIILSLFSFSLLASNAPKPKGYSLEQAKKYQNYNNELYAKQAYTQTLVSLEDRNLLDYVTIDRPFAEYKRTKYIVISDGDGFSSRRIKQTLAKHLPDDVSLVILTDADYLHYNVKTLYGKDIPEDRLEIITMPQAHGTFWARDALPVPVISTDNKLFMVDAFYDRFFNDQLVANYFNASLIKHSYRYEGGNFMPNDNIRKRIIITVSIAFDSQKYLPAVVSFKSIHDTAKQYRDSHIFVDGQKYF